MVLAAGLLFLFLVVAAVAIEVGWWLHAKRDAQNDVDATALAGAQELPDEAAALAMAQAWATKNGTTSGELDCCEFEDHTGDGAADLIRATIDRQPGLLTGQLLDIGDVTVTARAAAAKMRAVASCVPPWGIVPPDQALGPGGYWGLDPQALYIFHQSEFSTPGNFGALRLYGQGTPCYQAAIENACGACAGGCANGEPILIDDTLQCTTEPGLGGGSTCEALCNRYQPGWGDCHGGAPSDPCDAATYADAVILSATAACSDRKVPVPIIDAWPPQGTSAPIHILGIATFYIAGWDRKPPWGDVDVDSDTIEDDAMVWGYFLQDEPLGEAWEIVWDYSDDPFAPIKILLVE